MIKSLSVVLDSEYSIEETISYGKTRGWSENQILADLRLRLLKREDLNKQINGSSTPLMSAAAAGYISIVKVLLEAGADPLLRNIHNDDVIVCAKLSGKKALIDLVKNAIKDRKGSAVALLPILYYRPKAKTEAEYTFFPTKKFKLEHRAKKNDVGFFLNSKEVIRLDTVKESALKKSVLTIFINEGKVTLNIDAWDELSEKQVAGFIKKSSGDIHDISKIIREYLEE